MGLNKSICEFQSFKCTYLNGPNHLYISQLKVYLFRNDFVANALANVTEMVI
jgi:hypothetical protein